MSPTSPPRFLGVPTICVASAGTGKTHQITENLYVALEVKEFKNAQELLALTFTENAASEMRERIQAKLLGARGMKELPLAQQLNISTIHSFCRRELLRHAVRLGLDPAFSVLDEAQSQRLARRVLLGILRERFNSAEKRAKSALASGLSFNSYFRGSGFGSYLENEILHLYAQLRARGVISYNRELFLVAPSHWNEAKDAFLSELVRVDETPAKFARTDSSIEKVSNVQNFIRSRAKELKSLEPTEKTIWLLRDLAKTIRLQGTVEMRELLVPLREEVIPACIAAIIAQDSQAIRDEVAAILSELDARLNEEKRAARVLDFEDLQLRMLSALEGHPDLRESYRHRFSTVFVDEFQDTNPLQVRILELVAKERAHYFVGDPKQSIFGWRFAEPETIRQKQEAFQGKDGCVEKLTHNWRSRPEILDFVNRLFANGETMLGFEYDSLLPAGEQHEECSFREKNRPSIDVIVSPETEGEPAMPAQERRRLEAEAVAGYIREVVDEQILMHSKQCEEARPLQYGDFAILLRKNALVPLYEDALSTANIPFVSETSTGFLETPEISALCDLLQLLLTPENDLLLARVLRSDLVGLSANGLAELALARTSAVEESDKPAAMIHNLERGVAFSDPDDAVGAEEFVSWRTQTLHSLPGISASALLDRIVDGLRLREKLIARFAPARSLMNLDKFSDLAHRIEGLGYSALAELVELVREMRYQGAQIGEMWVEGARAVRIMTVHRAKGLTIPAVIIAGINYGLDRSPPALSVEPSVENPDHYELGIRHRLADSKSQEPWHQRHKERQQAREAWEEARLLYVALTRAVEHVAIFGVSTDPTPKNPWARNLSKLLREEATPADEFADLIDVRPMEFPPPAQGAPEEAPSLSELVSLTLAEVEDLDRSAALASELVREASAPPDITGLHRYLFGVSEFLDFLHTGELAATREADDEFLDHERLAACATGDETEREAALALGIAVHDLLAYVATRPEALKEGDLVGQLLGGEFIATHLPQHVEMFESQRERSAHLLQAYFQTGLQAAVAEAELACSEHAFLLRVESVFLRGRIDLLLVDDASVTVVDYKTDRVRDEVKQAELIERYRPQLLVYCATAQALYPGRELRVGLAFLDLGEVSWLNALPQGLSDIRQKLTRFARVAAGGGRV